MKSCCLCYESMEMNTGQWFQACRLSVFWFLSLSFCFFSISSCWYIVSHRWLCLLFPISVFCCWFIFCLSSCFSCFCPPNHFFLHSPLCSSLFGSPSFLLVFYLFVVPPLSFLFSLCSFFISFRCLSLFWIKLLGGGAITSSSSASSAATGTGAGGAVGTGTGAGAGGGAGGSGAGGSGPKTTSTDQGGMLAALHRLLHDLWGPGFTNTGQVTHRK